MYFCQNSQISNEEFSEENRLPGSRNKTHLSSMENSQISRNNCSGPSRKNRLREVIPQVQLRRNSEKSYKIPAWKSDYPTPETRHI